MAVSPVLFVISGFHGNTDPVFVMFALLSVYLLSDRRAPALAGLSIAIALSVLCWFTLHALKRFTHEPEEGVGKRDAGKD